MTEAAVDILMQCAPWQRAFTVQRETVRRFYRECSAVLRESCPLREPDPELLTLPRNLFSTLFLMAIEAAGVKAEKLPFYALVVQCLRVQVTGCDNLLDDEYKSVIPFDLPGSGTKFRSVLTVMAGDAVLAGLILAEVAAGRMDEASARRLQAVALSVLVPSGIEEHEEESGLGPEIPTADWILERIHPRKTGLLFEAPVRLVEKMGEADPERADSMAGALAHFGIACQLIDDLKDVADDLFFRKHNLIISEAFHGTDLPERQRIVEARQRPLSIEAARQVAEQLPRARGRCLRRAQQRFALAEEEFSRCFPEFGLPQAMALGSLVTGSIMSGRSEFQHRDKI